MPFSDRPATVQRPVVNKPSEEFRNYCAAEFERRRNSGKSFDEPQYQKAMTMVLDRLLRLEDEGEA